MIAQNETDQERLKDPIYVDQRVRRLEIDYVVLWPEFKGGTYYDPANWLEESLHLLCDSYWEIIYQNEVPFKILRIVFKVVTISLRHSCS